MDNETAKKPEFNTVKETEEVPIKSKKTVNSTVQRQKRLKEIEHLLDDLISKIVETVEQNSQSEEHAANTKDFLKELQKPSEILRRINDINIVQYLDRNRNTDFSTSEEATSNVSSILDDRVEINTEDMIENGTEKGENYKTMCGQSIPKSNDAAPKIELGYIGTNGQVSGEEILKEMKMVEKIELLVKNLIKEALESLNSNGSELNINKPIEKLERPMEQTVQHPDEEINERLQQPMSTTCLKRPDISIDCLQQPDKTTDCLHQPEMSTDCLQNSDISTDCLQQPELTIDCLQQPDISTDPLQRPDMTTDSLQEPDMTTDCLQEPDMSKLQKTNQLENGFQLKSMATDYLEQASVSVDTLQQSKSNVSETHDNTSTSSVHQINKSESCLHQASTQASSFQQTSTSTNSLKQANKAAHTLSQEIERDDYLLETVETAYQILKHQTNINLKTRRAATIIKNIAEESMQTNEQGMGVLKELQSMIEIVDGVVDLNEYLQMDTRKIFLEQRELKRISSFIYEHLVTLIDCRSKQFIKKEAMVTIKCGMRILADIGKVKLKMSSIFRDVLHIQRNFLIHSLMFSSVPYELLIGNRSLTFLIDMAKASVIRICGSIFNLEEMDDRFESITSDYRNVARSVTLFNEVMVIVDHKKFDKKEDDEEGQN